MSKRETMILELLNERRRVDVTQLSELLGVSQVTIRKDLAVLENRGVLKREHGYAVPVSSDDINSRIAIHHEEKQRIAKAAAALISPGETLMIESGSCCALLAEQVARNVSGATIITNSAFIAGYIRRNENAHIVLLGGDFQNHTQAMVGPILHTCAAHFYVDKLFIGADGFSQKGGFTGNDHLRAQAVRDMAEHAEKVYVVTESRKFDSHGIVPIFLGKQVYGVITDTGLSKEHEAALGQMGIRVIKT